MKETMLLLPCFLIFLSATLNLTEGYKVLGVFPTMSKSHYILGSAIMKRLAEEGHEVTVLTPFILNKDVANMTEVLVDGIVEKTSFIMDNILDFEQFDLFTKMMNLYHLGLMITNHTMLHPRVQELLHSKTKFDVVVVEVFVNEAMLGFGSHFNAPVVGMSTFGANNWINDMVGTPSPIAYNPMFYLEYTENMSFFQRIHNLFANALDEIIIRFWYHPQQKNIYDATFPNPKPDFHHILKNSVSIALLNSHYSTSYPRPYVPNMIEIGGAQIKRKSSPLPSNIKNVLDSAKNGVVYFSMGSNIKSTQLPKEKREAILKTFAKFPSIKFLWKWEDSELPGKPNNVHIQNWWPQDDLLAHPNVKCFITHGGLLGTSEAIYHGVPVIGVPVFGDQDLNMARATNLGYGLTVRYKNLTEESLTWALTEMLNDRKYKVRAIEISDRYRDQLLTPLDTATYWIEYVVRHKGAEFIKSPAQQLNFFQYHLLDIYGFLLGITFVVYYILKSILCKLCSGKKSGNISQKKKKN